MRLKDRVAIITGASSGIGKAIAVRFAAEGAHVVIADIREDPREGGDTTLDTIKAAGGDALFIHTDVSMWVDIDQLVTQTVAHYGKLDIMVNNAAIGFGKPLLGTTEEDWQRSVGVNLTGVFFGCKRAIQQMLTQDIISEARGRIVNISSQHGMIAAPNDFAYGVGKSGVVYMTRQIASDYAEQYIICNAVAPGKIITGKGGQAASEAAMAYSHARTPMPRLGKPQDVANAVLFLASDEASYITGENLLVDGGWMAS